MIIPILWVLGELELITIVATHLIPTTHHGATQPVLGQDGISALLRNVLDVTEVPREVVKLNHCYERWHLSQSMFQASTSNNISKPIFSSFFLLFSF